MSRFLWACDKARDAREAHTNHSTNDMLKAFSPFYWPLLQESVLRRPVRCFLFSFLNGKHVCYYVLLTLPRAEQLYIAAGLTGTCKHFDF